jgi:hypothetical protein
MSLPDNSGAAFPCSGYDGMTLRDYFAAKAMQAALSHPSGGGSLEAWMALNAKFAYMAADALLKAREA